MNATELSLYAPGQRGICNLVPAGFVPLVRAVDVDGRTALEYAESVDIIRQWQQWPECRQNAYIAALRARHSRQTLAIDAAIIKPLAEPIMWVLN